MTFPVGCYCMQALDRNCFASMSLDLEYSKEKLYFHSANDFPIFHIFLNCAVRII